MVDAVDATAGHGQQWPALRSVLLTATSKTAMGQQPLVVGDDEPTGSTSSSTSTSWTMPSPKGPLAASPSAGRCPAARPGDLEGRDLAMLRASDPSGKSSSGRSPMVGL